MTIIYYIGMPKFKYILFTVFLLLFAKSALALSVDYGTIIDIRGQNVLVKEEGIGSEANYICSISNLSCTPTKKESLGKTKKIAIKKSLQKEFTTVGAHHITFSPSRNLVAYYIPRNDTTNTSTYVIKNLKTKKNYKLEEPRNYWDLVTDSNGVFNFSPNERYLGYLDDKDGYMSIYLADTKKLSGDTISSSKLSTSALTIADFIFYDSQTIYYVGNQKNNPYLWSLYRLNIKTGKEKIIDTNVSYVDRLRIINQSIVYSRMQGDGFGPQIYNVSKSKIFALKIANVNLTKGVPNEEVVNISGMYGVLMKPSNFDINTSYPVLIWLHGGPVRQASYGFHPYHSYGIYDSILKLLQKNSVLVLKLDYRGSIGFGRDYSESIKDNVGKGDVIDVMNAVSYLKNLYKVGGVYLAGNSYGGYMSLESLAEHPDSFTAVTSINGVTDWQSLLSNIQKSIFNTEFGGLPSDSNQSLYDQASIANKIGNIGNQKIEIIAGEADKTIPFSQAEDMYNTLKNAGKNVSLVSYPGEDHVYKKKETLSDLCNQLFNLVGITPDPECNN